MKHLVLVSLVIFALSSLTYAQNNGKPAAHGMTGREFGEAVSAAAPISDHVSTSDNMNNGGGMPAAHGMTGREFGDAVSNVAPVGGIATHKKDLE